MACNNSRDTLFNVTNSSNLSSVEITIYFSLYARYLSFEHTIDQVSYISFIFSGSIGYLSHMITLFSIRHMAFTGGTYIYYRSMTIMELIHMVVMIGYGIIQLLGAHFIQTHFALATWSYCTYTGWHIGDMMKLAVSTVTAFISFERMVAVCFPFAIDTIKKNSIAYTGVFVSLSIGSAHLWSILAVKVEYDQQCGVYKQADTNFSKSGFYKFVVDFIFAVKVTLCLAILVFSIAMVVRLRKESKKVTLSNGPARTAWLNRRRLCMFSLILGLCTLFDHTVWISYKAFSGMTRSNGPVIGDKAIARPGVTLEGALKDLRYARMIVWIQLAQELLGQLVHCYRFFIHLKFNKGMRDAVKSVIVRSNNNRVTEIRTNQLSRR